MKNDNELNYLNIKFLKRNIQKKIKYLPNKLLSIWLTNLNALTSTSNWWVKLMMEWEEFWIEILRSGGIKNWMRTFIYR